MSERKYPLDVWYSGGWDDAEDVCASWGHHGKEAFAQAMEDEHERRPYSLDSIFHVWWRYDIAAYDPEGGPAFYSEVYQPGPGAKPVTVCYNFVDCGEPTP